LAHVGVRMADALRLGWNVFIAHTCRCGAIADAEGIHGLVCKQAPSRIARHQAINDVVVRAISSYVIPVTKEPIGLTRLDGKWSDRLTLILWHGGRPLMWDVTVVSTLDDSYMHDTSHSADGAAAETASDRKVQKYSSIPLDNISSQSHLRLMGCWTHLVLIFCMRSAVIWQFLLVTSVRPLSWFQRLSILTVLQFCSNSGIFYSHCWRSKPLATCDIWF